MSSVNINRVTISGNLTQAPDLRVTNSGSPVCRMRVAVNGRQKNAAGEWVNRPHYFDVTVWGAQASSCAQFLSKGRGVAVDGRLEWREWTQPEGGKRQHVQIIAETVQFLGSSSNGQAADQAGDQADYAPAHADVDDIPF